jgi:hypothetical protein
LFVLVESSLDNGNTCNGLKSVFQLSDDDSTSTNNLEEIEKKRVEEERREADDVASIWTEGHQSAVAGTMNVVA